MRKTEGRFRTWKSKKQWLFAGAVVTSLLLGAALVFGGLLGSLGGSSIKRGQGAASQLDWR